MEKLVSVLFSTLLGGEKCHLLEVLVNLPIIVTHVSASSDHSHVVFFIEYCLFLNCSKVDHVLYVHTLQGC